MNGKPITTPDVLFPEITYKEANRDTFHMIKYLLNFAFYKFGIEVTLVILAILICERMDIIAVLYSFWFYILFKISRETKQRIWKIFQIFIFIIIIYQYIIAVELPPCLCFGKWLWNSKKNVFQQFCVKI